MRIERIEKQAIRIVGSFSEERAPGAGKSFFFDLAEQAEDFLSGFALDDLLADLEGRDQFLGLMQFGEPQAFERFRFHPALFESARELRLQFRTDEFQDGEASENIDGGISGGLGAIQDGEVQRN